MAVGDVVSQAQNSSFTFQPASGVQVCITQIVSQGGTATAIEGRGSINTGSAYLSVSNGATDNTQGRNYLPNIKFFIDNASYLYFFGSSAYIGFSGIQTQ
jgi:hypothetical protein